MSITHDTGSHGRGSSTGSSPSSSSSGSSNRPSREGHANRNPHKDHHNDGASSGSASVVPVAPSEPKAADNYAEIIREQYDNWLDTFYPKQKELLQNSQNGTLLSEQLGRVDTNMAGSMRAAQLSQTNQLARYGTQATEDPNNSARQALATATAKNSLREYERDRATNALVGANAQQMEAMKG